MQTLVIFGLAFVVVSVCSFMFGFYNGQRKMEHAFLDNTMYVTIRQLEDLVKVMRFNGAKEDEAVVMVKTDWWEEADK